MILLKNFMFSFHFL